MPPNYNSAAATSSAVALEAAAAAFASATPSVASSAGPAVARLFSVHSAPLDSKILHLVRHAEGTHNVSPDSHKAPAHWDARLTPKGVEQCFELAQRTIASEIDCIVVSPTTRCMQTAALSFPHCVASVPFVAHESWRETCNFLCDSRRPLTDLRAEFPLVDFGHIEHEHDPLWAKYEKEYGTHSEFDGLRESKDGAHLAQRAKKAWNILHSRPEKNIALVSHSAFFMHIFQPYLEEMFNIVSFEDDDVRELMTANGFTNCELRSVAFNCNDGVAEL